MLTITRSQARHFRAVLRRAGIGKQPGGFGPSFLMLASADGLRLRAMSSSAAIELAIPGNYQPQQVFLPLEMLAACEGRTSDGVAVQTSSEGVVTASWTDQGIPQLAEYSVATPDDLPPFPAAPEQLADNAPELWSAFRDAVATTDDESVRYALGCLQLRGRTGEIVATDGRQVLVQRGFAFPWPDDLLVLGTPVLGCRELEADCRDGRGIALGRSEDWLTLVGGAWTIALRIEQERRFPQIEAVVPSASAATSRLRLDDADARFLSTALDRLPGQDRGNAPVTLDLNGHVAVRGRAEGQSRATELILSNSRREGDVVALNTNRQYLARAVQMGFRELCLFGPESPALCDDGRRQYVWALLEKDGLIPADEDAIRIESPATDPRHATADTSAHRSRRFDPMPSAASQSPRRQSPTTQTAPTQSTPTQSSPKHRATKPTTSVPQAARWAQSDVAQLVKLRDDLKAAVAQTNEILRTFKRQKREARLLQSTLATLQQLHQAAS